MTFAWDEHLKAPECPLYLALLTSWGIAFVGCCPALPAKRNGYASATRSVT